MSRAYGNCRCSCHSNDAVRHVMACCHPSDDVDVEFGFIRRLPVGPERKARFEKLEKQAEKLRYDISHYKKLLEEFNVRIDG